MKNIKNDMDLVCEETHLHENIDKVFPLLPDDEQIFELTELFRAFGDTTRTKILSALYQRELCVCDIAKIVDMSVSAVSHQLRVLRLNNLVKYKKIGKEVKYSFADKHIAVIYKTALEHIKE